MKRLKPVRTAAPAARLLERDEVKQSAPLRIDFSDDDAELDALILAAEEMLDGYSGILGRPLITQTWAESMSHFEYRMRLRLRGVQSIVSVTYFDADEVSQTVAADVYRLHEDAAGPYLVQRDDRSWPGTTATRDDAVTITYTAGYGDAADDVPAPIRRAAMMMVWSWYDQPDLAGKDITGAAEALLRPYMARRGFYACMEG